MSNYEYNKTTDSPAHQTSAFLSVCECVSFYLSTYISVYLSLYLLICIPVCLSLYLPVCLSDYLAFRRKSCNLYNLCFITDIIFYIISSNCLSQ